MSTHTSVVRLLGSRSGTPALMTLLGLVLTLFASPAFAQLNVLAPAFRNLNGAAIWGSVGYSTTTTAGNDGDRRPMWRGGFAAFYGPFGGRGDTVITFTQTVSDSADTTLCDGSEAPLHRLHRNSRSTREMRVDSKRLGGDGKVTLLVGYQHSTFFRLGLPLLHEPVPVGGIFLASLLGPYRLPLAPRRLQCYVGAGGTIVQLTHIAARADTLAVELSTERSVAPEALLMLMYRVAPGYRVFMGASYQYLRFGSVTYHAVQAGDRIPAGTLATLPEELKLESAHFSVGISFAANGLLPGR